jgi:hypothetical protein
MCRGEGPLSNPLLSLVAELNESITNKVSPLAGKVSVLLDHLAREHHWKAPPSHGARGEPSFA